MRNLFGFISKYSSFLLFLIFETIALFIFLNHNDFQNASFISSSNVIIGNIYAQIDQITSYLNLKAVNNQLAQENAQLRNQLKSSFYADTFSKRIAKNASYEQQYHYIVAKVISNSINRGNNYLVINAGNLQGIKKNMGVICTSGVVGLVVNTSKHFSLVQSLLHKNTKLSAMLQDSKEFGSLIWGDDFNPKKALLVDIPNSAKIEAGSLVVTSEYSLFPMGTPIGRTGAVTVKPNSNFLNVEVMLCVDFTKLEFVYVISNKLASEQLELVKPIMEEQ